MTQSDIESLRVQLWTMKLESGKCSERDVESALEHELKQMVESPPMADA